jgi:hypothetical protein
VGEFGFLMPEKEPEAHRLTLGGSLEVRAALGFGFLRRRRRPPPPPTEDETEEPALEDKSDASSCRRKSAMMASLSTVPVGRPRPVMIGSGDLVAVLADMLSGSGECWAGLAVVGRRVWVGISLQQWKL